MGGINPIKMEETMAKCGECGKTCVVLAPNSNPSACEHYCINCHISYPIEDPREQKQAITFKNSSGYKGA